MTQELGDVIAERDFEVWDADGNAKPIKVLIGKPYRDQNATSILEWKCPFQIVGIGLERVKTMQGIDGLDAILNALRIAEVCLKSYIRGDLKKVTWLGDEEWFLYPPSEAERGDATRTSIEDDDNPFRRAFDEFFKNFDVTKRHD